MPGFEVVQRTLFSLWQEETAQAIPGSGGLLGNNCNGTFR
jgi:hypothetical protein